MKKNIIYAIFAAVICLMQSCALDDFDPKTWAIEPELKLEKPNIVFNSVANPDTLRIETNYDRVSVSSDNSWCVATLDKAKSAIEIAVENNPSAEQRTAIITVSISRGTKSLSRDITVIQLGGKWEQIDGFPLSVFWSYDISASQKETISNLLKNMVYVDGGTFRMGAQKSDPLGVNYSPIILNTQIVHPVILSDFLIGKYELTQKEWNAVMGSNNCEFHGENLPVENVTYSEALNYISKLSKLTGLDLRLPTEAQWEYAARGGRYSMGYQYSGSDDYEEVAHSISASVSSNSPSYTTAPVGSKKPNELGIYDMSGNVYEFCSDWYDAYYPEEEVEDPQGPSSGTYRTTRGGDFKSLDHYYCVYERNANTQGDIKGFRIVCIPNK